MSYWYLAIGIVTEVVGSGLLKRTNGFKKIVPTILCLAFYGSAYYAVSLSLREIPLNVAYATWCGAGTVFTAMVGVLCYHERLSKVNVLGLIILVSGIVMLNYF